MMPLFHIHGLVGSVAASLASGGSVICAPGIVADQVLEWLIELKPTWYSAVPTLHQAILEQARQHPELAKQVNLRFIRSCSSALAPQLAQDLESTFHAPVLEAYGMTEAAHQIATDTNAIRVGSVACAVVQRRKHDIELLPQHRYVINRHPAKPDVRPAHFGREAGLGPHLGDDLVGGIGLEAASRPLSIYHSLRPLYKPSRRYPRGWIFGRETDING